MLVLLLWLLLFCSREDAPFEVIVMPVTFSRLDDGDVVDADVFLSAINMIGERGVS